MTAYSPGSAGRGTAGRGGSGAGFVVRAARGFGMGLAVWALPALAAKGIRLIRQREVTNLT